VPHTDLHPSSHPMLAPILGYDSHCAAAWSGAGAHRLKTSAPRAALASATWAQVPAGPARSLHWLPLAAIRSATWTAALLARAGPANACY